MRLTLSCHDNIDNTLQLLSTQIEYCIMANKLVLSATDRTGRHVCGKHGGSVRLLFIYGTDVPICRDLQSISDSVERDLNSLSAGSRPNGILIALGLDFSDVSLWTC